MSERIENKKTKFIKLFSEVETWEERYKILIDLGKNLPPYDLELKTDQFKIHGCQSDIWLCATYSDDRISLSAHSESLIIKGILAIILAIFSGETAATILKTDLDFLQEIGLDQQLSINRTNTINLLLKKIKLIAQESTQKP